jgi:large subunit ribosomal protein L37Ae
MVLEKVLRSAKRFGARYGRKLRQKTAKIEAEQRKRHKCPYCHAPAVRRLAAGIWNCKKCSSKFTGKAYTIPKKIIIKQEISKEEIVEHEEEKEEEEGEKAQTYKEKKKEEKKEEMPAEEKKKEVEEAE